MKKTVSPVAFATILIPMILSANSTTVTFDTALTNGTEWAYSKVKFTTGANSHVYFDTLGACVYSPEYPFNITEVEITLSCTSKEAARYLQVKPSSGDSQQTKSVEAKEKKEVQHFLFAEEDGVFQQLAFARGPEDQLVSLGLQAAQGVDGKGFFPADFRVLVFYDGPVKIYCDNHLSSFSP